MLVLEARSRLGGRATAFADRATGELVDNGQHVLLGCYVETFAFLARSARSITCALQPQLSVTMIDRAGRRSRLVCPPLPAPLHLVAGMLEWDALSWADRLSALRMAAPEGRDAPGRADGGAPVPQRVESAASADRGLAGRNGRGWLIRNGQTERLREMLWARSRWRR